VRKKKRDDANTIFSADWSRKKIIEEIDSAWKNKMLTVMDNKWKGRSKMDLS
jgi:hypothetical protein